MYHGILVDQQFSEPSFPEKFKVFMSKQDGPWKIYGIEVEESELKKVIAKIQEATKADQPWYAHFYNKEKLIVVFKNRVFEVAVDPTSWQPVIEYGKSLNLPVEQLDFSPTSIDQEPEYFEINDHVIFGVGLTVQLPKKKLKPGTVLYIAGPQGFAEATRHFHGKVAEIITKMGGIVLDPWLLTPPEVLVKISEMPISPEKVEKWKAMNSQIGKTNIDAIRQATGVIANLDGTDVDSGTASEIGAAYMRNIPILGYRGDFCPRGDNVGGIVNMQVEYFIRDSASGKGEIIQKIVDLPQAILKIWG